LFKYSVLTTDVDMIVRHEEILDFLAMGMKVIIFADQSLLNTYKEDTKTYSVFINIRLLQLYEIDRSVPTVTIYDGVITDSQRVNLEVISSSNIQFNLEQYLIEHAPPEKSLTIEASAGTGKTTVMIDRVMYLIHVIPDLSLAEIGMITFTNEATQNMRHKIQDAILNRYKATLNPWYINVLEDEAKMRTQTIHSFSKSIISELGPSLGMGKTFDFEALNMRRSN
jgi:DNA helicase II / ATP-dependent DNA helicase PcrA